MGWPVYQFLYDRCNIIGTFSSDPCHHFSSSLENAMAVAGFAFLIKELTIPINLSHGPWAGAAFYQTISAAAKSYHNVTDYTCPFSRCTTKTSRAT